MWREEEHDYVRAGGYSPIITFIQSIYIILQKLDIKSSEL